MKLGRDFLAPLLANSSFAACCRDMGELCIREVCCVNVSDIQRGLSREQSGVEPIELGEVFPRPLGHFVHAAQLLEDMDNVLLDLSAELVWNSLWSAWTGHSYFFCTAIDFLGNLKHAAICYEAL